MIARPPQRTYLAMSLACTRFGLTPAEAFQGTTVHAAAALGLSDCGTIEVGKRADLAFWDIERPAELCYWFGVNPCAQVVRNGTIEAAGIAVPTRDLGDPEGRYKSLLLPRASGDDCLAVKAIGVHALNLSIAVNTRYWNSAPPVSMSRLSTLLELP